MMKLILKFIFISAFLACNLKPNKDIHLAKIGTDLQLSKPIVSKVDEPITYPQNFFEWPIKGVIDLAGNFGELRTNHFHSGLDIRTNEGQEGIPIYASADGYVSRIGISPKGYGKALYINHENGFTSVYGHLQKMAGDIHFYLQKCHRDSQKYELQLYPEKSILRVKKGDLIAYSGNTGGSGGPHLHFEIRNSKTDVAYNPLLFDLKLNDVAKPKIKGISLFKIDANYKSLNYNYIQKSALLSNQVNLVSEGQYGIGANWIDFLRQGGFRMGIPYAKVYCNNSIIFEQKIEKIPFEDWRYINCHVEYLNWEKNGSRVVKLFRDENNLLDIYTNEKNKGLFYVKQDEKLFFKIVISDFKGYKDSVSFYIQGTKTMEPKTTISEHLWYANKENEWKAANNKIQVLSPKLAFYFDFLPNFSVSDISNIYGFSILKLNNQFVPIHIPIELKFDISSFKGNSEKLMIQRTDFDAKKRNEGGVIIGTGSKTILTSHVKNFGTFEVIYDTTAPLVKAFVVSGRYFRAKVSDAQSGVSHASLYVDGEWVLCEYEPKNSSVFGQIPNFISEGLHTLELVVFDERKNKTSITQKIKL